MIAAPGQKEQRKRIGRPFPKGESGNPKGRPAGLKNKLTVLANDLMQEDAEAVVRAVIRKAKRGDVLAARVVLERVLPVRRGAPVQFDLPELKTAPDLVLALGAVLQSVSQGKLTPDEGAVIATLLDAQRKALDAVDIEQRLAALEAQLRVEPAP